MAVCFKKAWVHEEGHRGSKNSLITAQGLDTIMLEIPGHIVPSLLELRETEF